MSNSLGYSNLASFGQLFADWTRIENSAANLVRDLEHLVMGSFVYSCELVRNTAMLSPIVKSVQNGAEVNGKVPAETADFVLESPDVQTMSVRVLISVPTLFVFLWLWILVRKRVMSSWAPLQNDNVRDKFLARSLGLSAVQLYRYLDEEISGSGRWEGHLSSAPYIESVGQDELDYKVHTARTERIPVSAQYTGTSETHLAPVVVDIDMDDDTTLPNSPVVSKYAIPKLMPLYNPDGSTAGGTPVTSPTVETLDDKKALIKASDPNEGHLDDNKNRSTTITTTEILLHKEGPTRINGKYELAMVSAWRRSFALERDRKLNWNSVQTGSRCDGGKIPSTGEDLALSDQPQLTVSSSRRSAGMTDRPYWQC